MKTKLFVTKSFFFYLLDKEGKKGQTTVSYISLTKAVSSSFSLSLTGFMSVRSSLCLHYWFKQMRVQVASENIGAENHECQWINIRLRIFTAVNTAGGI